MAKSVVIKGACYTIGDGASIDVWQDPWVPWVQGFIPKPKDSSSSMPHPPPIKVSQLVDLNIHCWKSQIIHQLFEPIAARATLSILIPTSPKQDKLMWVSESKGSFTVKSAYLTANFVLNVLKPTNVN